MPVEFAPVRLGARRSPLARAQVDLVAAALAAFGVESRYVGVTTSGDVDQRALTDIGGTGVFAGAVRDALRAGEIDVAVHSLKDLPTAAEDELEIAAIPVREDARDVLVGRTLEELGSGVRIGTGAPRRAVQLLDWAGHRGIEIEVVPVRGNVDTRLRLAERGEVDAVVLAAAGLRRLGYLDDADSPLQLVQVKNLRAQILDYDVILPAPGQGALALEIHRSLRMPARSLVERLDDPATRAEVLVERGFLAALEAGCTAPVGARATLRSAHGSSLDLTLAAVIGRTLLSNVSEPAKAAHSPTSSRTSPIEAVSRFDLRGVTADPARFGAEQAALVLASLPAPQV